ncbi:hypothetical protein K491DRAFT_598372 [Lophiostoma macrostomum CBS 122681]|uniref:Uncharacterized protein n=1 Tax=Lophiostoma macrostomum CBS 122681 TaxID=1314788 RepID=A0A6A6T7P9_9PLEO|nr:hypothetical protein K491DRAFT_598372 [Lophiostoma macrostomum CBS 122681]
MSLNSHIKDWQPFKIDALGLVTLLGTDAVRKCLGRLVYSPFENFPLLAGHIFAGNTIADPIPGFILYNITEGIMATDLSAWFTRWLLCQKITSTDTRLTIDVIDPTPDKTWFTATIAACTNIGLVLFPALIKDWYGFVSAFGLVLTIGARAYVLWDLRKSIDGQTTEATIHTETKKVKVLIKLPNGSKVIVDTTTGIVQNCLLREARPRDYHSFARAVCWIGFAFHAVFLGMACLCVQLAIVGLTLVCSVLAVSQVGCIESHVGSRLRIELKESLTYGNAGQLVLLEMTNQEQDCMESWSMVPGRVNTIWWDTYTRFDEDVRATSDVAKDSVLRGWGKRMREASEATNVLEA